MQNHEEKVGTWPENDTYFLRKATRFINIADGYEAYKYDIKNNQKNQKEKILFDKTRHILKFRLYLITRNVL